MAMLGMQADMQCSYFPRCYSTRDLNLNASCSIWPSNNFEKILKNGHYYSGSLIPQSSDQHLAYKEILKQTMLQHEAIFRDQIHELHRLYSRQRELMAAMKSSELYRHHIQLETLQSNLVWSQNSFEYSQKTCQISSLPWLNAACSQLSVSGAENNPSHLSDINGNAAQAQCNPAQTEGYIVGSELLDSKCKKIGEKILDLELPGDEYIDSEEEQYLAGEKGIQLSQEPSYPQKMTCEDVQKSDVEPSHAIIDLNLAFQEDEMTQTSLSVKPEGLADLNEPIKLEEEVDPESRGREIPCQGVCGKTNSDLQIQPKEIVQNTQTRRDPDAYLNVLHLGMNESQQERLRDNHEAGQNSSDLNSFLGDVCAEVLSTSSEEAEIDQTHETSTSYLLDHSSGKLWGERTNFGSQHFASDLSINSYPEQVAPACKHNSNQLVPLADVFNCESFLVSSWRKHTQEFVRAPVAIQALPCFNSSVQLSKTSKFKSPGIARDKSCHGKNLKFNRKFYDANVWGGFCDGYCEFASEDSGPKTDTKGPVDVKPARDIDLNSVSPSCSSDVDALNTWIADRGKKLDNSTGGLSLLRAKLLHIVTTGEKCRESTQVELASYLDVESNKVEASERSGCKRLHGMLIKDKPYTSDNQCSCYENLPENDDADDNERGGVLDINLDGDTVLDSGEQLTASEQHGKKFSGFGFSRDIDSCLNKEESSPTPSMSAETDLEAPASPENKESSPPRGESDENQLETAFQQSGHENADQLGELVRIAAEVIVSISSQVQTSEERATLQSSEALQVDTLYWFARTVSSVVDDLESEFGVAVSCKNTDDHDEYVSDGIDSFEAMTLELKEINVEEYYCKANVEEEAASPASLPSQPRKCRTRKRRQQREDFQSEILPSLASLSRCEVNEDLQALGGFVEGTCTRSTTGAKKAGRNGCMRGRRRRSSSNVKSEQTRHNGLGIEERSLIGWGNITRRRRGQRCPASNPRLILSQA